MPKNPSNDGSSLQRFAKRLDDHDVPRSRATKGQLDALESAVGHPLPADYRKFLSSFGGAEVVMGPLELCFYGAETARAELTKFSELAGEFAECVDDEHCPAGRPRCDMTQNTCVECLGDSECDDGSPCTVEGCEDGVCRVEAAPAGTPCADGICNGVETAPQCVECLADAMCDDGLECTDDLCRDSVCTHPASPAGTPCSIGRCDADEVAPRCRECASDAECGEFARYCSPEGRCTRCRDDAHCEDENPCTIDACAGGECVFSPVAAGTPCGAGTCNGDSRAPVCEECARDIECDDGDPCTRDGCRLGVCVHLPACVDAGVDTGADAGDPWLRGPAGCACRAAGSGARSGAPLPLFALLVLFIARAGRRRRAAR